MSKDNNLAKELLDKWPVVLKLFFGVVAISILAVFVVMQLILNNNSHVKIVDGNITIGSLHDPEAVIFPLSATQLWADTGINVRKGQKLTFNVAGAVNTAIHRIVTAGKYDTHPHQLWESVPGQSSGARPRDYFILRSKMYPEAEYGSILAYVCCPGMACPTAKPDADLLRLMKDSRNDSEKSGMKVVIDSNDINKPGILHPSCDGRLYLTINENVPIEPKQFIGTMKEHSKDIEATLTKVESGRIPRAQIYDEIILEWLTDGIQWHRKYMAENGEAGKSFYWINEEDCKFPAVCDLEDKNGKINEENIQRCVNCKCGDSFKKIYGEVNKAKEMTSLEIAEQLLPVYPKMKAAMKKADLKAECYKLSNNSLNECLASLRVVSDYYRWEYTVIGYPNVWYDDNTGMFLVTVQFDD